MRGCMSVVATWHWAVKDLCFVCHSVDLHALGMLCLGLMHDSIVFTYLCVHVWIWTSLDTAQWLRSWRGGLHMVNNDWRMVSPYCMCFGNLVGLIWKKDLLQLVEAFHWFAKGELTSPVFYFGICKKALVGIQGRPGEILKWKLLLWVCVCADEGKSYLFLSTQLLFRLYMWEIKPY